MKKVNLHVLTDTAAMSRTLDQALFLLGKPPVELRLSQLSHATGLHSSVLTRMRLLHVNPQYGPVVNKLVLFNLLRYLMQQFPTLVLQQVQDGKIHVRLYKSHNGCKLTPLPALPAIDPPFKRNPPKPGSTRWFLAQLETSQAALGKGF